MLPGWPTVYTLGYTLAMSELAIARSLILRSDDAVCATALAWGHGVCRACGVEVRTRGAETVDWSEPHVVLSNHQSLLDIPVILSGLGRWIGFLTKKELFHVPAFGGAIDRLGCVPIDRSDSRHARQALEGAAKRVREGSSIVVFPEGTRSPDGSLLPFKKGPFHLIQQSGVSAIPIALRGTRDILPRGSLRPRPGTVELRVGPPLRSDDDSADARERLRARAQAEIGRLLSEP
ncbi:MAG TPA: lysophospholipid acyltransferase family protein [Polyangiaceae bacterium]|nr:lysophospholipid acyltransferase family protein [Polyangiaceae bacterium]